MEICDSLLSLTSLPWQEFNPGWSLARIATLIDLIKIAARAGSHIVLVSLDTFLFPFRNTCNFMLRKYVQLSSPVAPMANQDNPILVFSQYYTVMHKVM
jgi:hypothetical protein